MNRFSVLNPRYDWDEVVELGKQEWKEKSLHVNIRKLVLSATVYNVRRN